MVKSILACGLQECLSKEWMGDNFSDFRVVVDGSQYFCHKFILSACSTFFKTLLSSDFREKKEECVELKNMSKETFDVIINAIYKGVDDLTKDNIISVWQATHMLHIPFLIEECERFVVENMSQDNFVTFYEIATLLNSKSVISLATDFIKKHYEQFIETDTFLELKHSVLLYLIDDDCLNVLSEDVVLDSIINWVSYINYKSYQTKDSGKDNLVTSSSDFASKENTECDLSIYNQLDKTANSKLDSNKEMMDRKQYLVGLLTMARPFLASRSYLENLLINPLIRENEKALKIVYEALLYQWTSVSYSRNLVIPHRKCSGKRNVMAYIHKNKLNLLDVESLRTFELDLGLVLGTCWDNASKDGHRSMVLASIESSLCFVYSNTGKVNCEFSKRNHLCCYKNLAIIDENKKVSTLKTFCGESPLEIVSVNRDFIAVGDCTFKTVMEDGAFSCVDFKFSLPVSSVCVFQDYILIFYNKNGTSKVQCCNMSTKSSQEIDFDSQVNTIITIQKGRQVYILLQSGTLKEVEIAKNSTISFKLVTQLWTSLNQILLGAVCYKDELLLFCSKYSFLRLSLLKSVPGIFESIRVIEVDSDSNIVPLVVSESWCSKLI
ncbi:uncharacterized protein LOC131940460 [Physella acuta]|uniref:uncharacterized protein LOC131940460 n=1 Tax=Physella acuta TaxID=109671 RepID=UPI0027DBE857|nr:uncharacterized protein LOC131940460 [Physella acuta]